MLDREFQSIAEIDKTYHDHIESLRMSGLPFDEVGLVREWTEAIQNFKDGLTKHPDFTQL